MRRVTILVVLILWGFSAVWAGAEYRWSGGLKFGYMLIPDFVLDAFYEKHTSIFATPLGAEFGFRFEDFDMFVSIEHYFLNFENGKWLVKDKDKSETDYVESELDLTALELDTLWRVPIHETIDWKVGFGLGLGILSGHYYSWDVNPETGKKIEDSKEEPSRPSVIPTGGFITGFSFYPYPWWDVHVDFGLRPGVYLALGTRFFF